MEKIEKLKAFLRENPEDAFLNHALALEYIKEGNDAGAKDIFLDILRRDPAYVGSYYHLARLLERMGEPEIAKSWYEKGMEAANKTGDRHAYGELQAALDDLMD